MPSPVPLRTTDGVRLHALHYAGADRAIGCVVVHGFTMSSRHPHVRRIAAGLSDGLSDVGAANTGQARIPTEGQRGTGMGVLTVDLRGHGRSAGLSTAGAEEIHDVAAAVAWLRAAGYQRVVTLGWSMGGSAVLRHAGLGGDTDAVVSVSSPGMWFERGTRPMRLVHWMFEHRSGRLATRALRRTRVLPGGWRIVPEPPVEVVGSIDVPVLIVHGDADRYFPLRHVDALAAAAPAADVWVETGMGHAEIATDDERLARIVGWVRTSCAEPNGVWDHESRD